MFDVKHLIDEAVKFVLAFFQHSKTLRRSSGTAPPWALSYCVRTGDDLFLWPICPHQERIKGTEKASPIQPYSIGNSSRVILRIGIKLPRALLGCFVEVSHD